jgi:hypothetical protein
MLLGVMIIVDMSKEIYKFLIDYPKIMAFIIAAIFAILATVCISLLCMIIMI